jgi:hypothetical protein
MRAWPLGAASKAMHPKVTNVPKQMSLLRSQGTRPTFPFATSDKSRLHQTAPLLITFRLFAPLRLLDFLLRYLRKSAFICGLSFALTTGIDSEESLLYS